MKIRTNFVSNSSSSSFIINNKDVFENFIDKIKNTYGADYYILDDVLYTSCISDSLDTFNELYDLADDNISTGFDCPYDIDNFVELEGILGINSVYIEKNKFKDLVEVSKNSLYNFVVNTKDSIDTEDIEELKFFYEECKRIIDGENNEN